MVSRTMVAVGTSPYLLFFPFGVCDVFADKSCTCFDKFTGQ
jgi:hypothetical protein